MNKVVLIGRLTKDVDLKFTPGSNIPVVTFNLAVDRKVKKEGHQQADFIPVVLWGKIAEAAAQNTCKGKLIAVSGRIQTRSYKAKDGSMRFVTEVIAEETKYLSPKSYTSHSTPTRNSNYIPEPDMSLVGDVPF